METKTDSRPPFERTTCACDRCVVGCRTKPGALAPGDLQRMADYLGVRDFFKWAGENFDASEGALVADAGTGQAFRVPSIVPKLRGGRCVFLGDDGRCGVHPVSPFGCSHIDTHLSREEGDRRVRWLLGRQMAGEDGYAMMAEALRRTGNVAPPLAERQDNFNREFAAI